MSLISPGALVAERGATVTVLLLSGHDVGEDLLLLAINKRNGRIRLVERIGIALRAAELVDLTFAGRTTIDEQAITVLDPTSLDHPRLERALTWMRDKPRPASVDGWLRQRFTAPGIIRQYITLLADQGASKVERRGQGAGASTRITVLDQDRYANARARIDALARGDTADAQDRALAVIVYACGLDRFLYRGLRGRAARRRLARASDQAQVITDIRSALRPADPEFTDAAARALTAGLTPMLGQLHAAMHHAYIGQAQHNAGHGHSHHGSSPGSEGHGHHGHHGGYGHHGGGGGHGGGHH